MGAAQGYSGPRISLSTSSVYPASAEEAFASAGRLGFDGVEVMVGVDDVSADRRAVKALALRHRMPVVSVHAPCLLLTQHVWGTEPWGKLHRSAEMAADLGAEVVVVHPPFRWQRDYARGFVDGIAELEARHGIAFAVENMYPWRTGRRVFQAYAPGWDPVEQSYAHTTLDLSHSATAGQDALESAKALGDRLTHVHLTDGGDSAKDEHLVPGHGDQPVAELLTHLVDAAFGGEIVVEINTRRADDAEEREAMLLESLAFARLHT